MPPLREPVMEHGLQLPYFGFIEHSLRGHTSPRAAPRQKPSTVGELELGHSCLKGGFLIWALLAWGLPSMMVKTFSEFCHSLKLFLLNPSFPLPFPRSQTCTISRRLPLPAPSLPHFIPYHSQALSSLSRLHISFLLASASKRSRA